MSAPAHADVVLLTREIPNAQLLELYADACNAGMVTLPSSDGGTATVFFEEGGIAVVITVPKMIEFAADMSRVLGIDARDLPGGARYWTEAVVAVDPAQLGFAVVTALADHCGGHMVLRASGTVI